jgi:SAM-dependent methyltransferase
MERGVYESMRAIEQDHWWFAGRREILASEIARLPLPKPAQALEVGCANGGNLEMLARFGEVCAVEPDPDALKVAVGRGIGDVRQGMLPDGLPDFGRRFDLVGAFDVIEHVDDDQAAVAALAAQLKPGGFLVATVPAYRWMWSEHDDLNHHKRRYVRGALQRLAGPAGLTVRRASYFNSLLFPPIAGVRLARSALGVRGGYDEAMPPAPVNRLFRAIFASERALLRAVDLPFGVSILLVAQRPA